MKRAEDDDATRDLSGAVAARSQVAEPQPASKPAKWVFYGVVTLSIAAVGLGLRFVSSRYAPAPIASASVAFVAALPNASASPALGAALSSPDPMATAPMPSVTPFQPTKSAKAATRKRATAPTVGDGCTPPYVVDPVTGKRRLKSQCLH